jgi:hypothetical protein
MFFHFTWERQLSFIVFLSISWSFVYKVFNFIGMFTLKRSKRCLDVYVDSSDVIRGESSTVPSTTPSPNVRRRFLSGNLLAAPSVESLSTIEGQLRRNSTLPSSNNIRHRSGSFNPTILSQHRMGKEFCKLCFKVQMNFGGVKTMQTGFE